MELWIAGIIVQKGCVPVWEVGPCSGTRIGLRGVYKPLDIRTKLYHPTQYLPPKTSIRHKSRPIASLRRHYFHDVHETPKSHLKSQGYVLRRKSSSNIQIPQPPS